MSRSRVIFDRNQIIEVAYELVRQEGDEALSSRRICKELNVSSMTIYNYVDTMDEIKLEVILKIFDAMYRRIYVELNANRATVKEPAAFCKTLAMAMYDFAIENTHLFLFLCKEKPKYHNNAEVRPFYRFYSFFKPHSGPDMGQKHVAILYEHMVVSLLYEHILKINVISREEYAEYIDMFAEKFIVPGPNGE